MKYSITLGLMSLALLAASVLYPAIQWLLVWSALSFAVVALGYAGLGPRVFGKRSSGRILLPLKIANFPYLAYTWSIWHLYRLISREAAYNTINDNLVIGRRLMAREATEGFEHYVDLTAEFEEAAPIRSRVGYRCLPILDASVPTVEELRHAVELSADGRAFVHCAQGHGRTGLFALALLLRRGDVNTVDEGVDLLRSLRPAVKLNSKQLKFARRYLEASVPQEAALFSRPAGG